MIVNNIHIIFFFSGEEAIEFAKLPTKYDLIISDIGLPDMNGWELIKELQALYQDKMPPSIALSGYGMEEDIKKSLNAGFKTHITKPVQWNILKDSIAHVLK